jgi:hypothetical protein
LAAAPSPSISRAAKVIGDRNTFDDAILKPVCRLKTCLPLHDLQF